jgi:GrpB protein
MATLVEYDPAWRELFAREAERIRGALGAGALLIEHVGSTAVPGLAARPLIDTVLACAADRERYGAGKAQDNARRDVMEAIAARALVPALRPIGLDDAAALADLYAANRDYLRPFEPRHDEAFSPRRPSASVRRRRSPMRTPTGATAT